jgi:anaerobic magnesium-protoporphyrin IX monomethyl ester cyclase
VARIVLYCARFTGQHFALAPLGPAYLASSLVAEGLAREEDVTIVDSIDEALAFKPDIVGVSAVSQVIGDARQFAGRCRAETGSVTVLGGYHISCMPDRLPPEFDLGVIGEGERTFMEIVRRFAGGPPDNAALAGVTGTCYRRSGRVEVAPRRSRIMDLDALPAPDRRRRYGQDEPVLTSRGCPFNCVFCASHGFWGDLLRLRSAGNVVDEITRVVETCAPREIAIVDDLWMANKSRFRAIAGALIARGIPERVSMRGFCRSNVVVEEDVRLLKDLNYRVVRFGAETGSNRLLTRLKGPGISVADHERLINLCAAHGLPCRASFMFGSPGETDEDIRETMAFLRRHKGRFGVSGLYLFNPIPGTVLWEELAAKGQVSLDMDFSKMRMDLRAEDFDWEHVPYFNEDNVSRERLRDAVETVIRESED